MQERGREDAKWRKKEVRTGAKKGLERGKKVFHRGKKVCIMDPKRTVIFEARGKRRTTKGDKIGAKEALRCERL